MSTQKIKQYVYVPEVLDNLQKITTRMGATVVVLKSRRIAIGQFTFSDGQRCYFFPHSLDINPVGAATLVRDKDMASRFMSRMGYSVIEGKAFFLKTTKTSIFRTVINRAYKYATQLGFPVVIKPNSGSRGHGISVVATRGDFLKAMKEIVASDNIALVQRYASGRDYRVVVYKDTVITACERLPLSVVGNGRSTIMQLLRRKKKSLAQRGRLLSCRNHSIREKLKRSKLTMRSIPAKDERVFLLDVANLMSGGDAIDVTADIHPEFAKTAVKLTRDMGLCLSSVDFIIEGNITEKPGNFWILEINSAPGLDHFIKNVRSKTTPVADLYLKVMKGVKK